MHRAFSRRRFLRRSGAAAGALLAAPWSLARSATPARPRVAAIFTAFSHRWHAHVILENFLERYLFNGEMTDPGVEVVSFFADQFPTHDMARPIAKQYGIPLYPTIDDALCLGGSKLAVDAVLSIGEHGSYPSNELGQHMYPRKEFFDAIVNVMRRSGRSVPLFNDKHLCHRWDWAKEMYDTTVELGIPYMAGSSVPLAQRTPPLDIPPGAAIDEAISIHGGGVESYDFHCLEVLQSMVEARQGGETGISSVEFLDNDRLWNAAAEGRWSPQLAQAAMEAGGEGSVSELRDYEKKNGKAYGVLVRYKDGLKGLALRLSRGGTAWHFACRYKGNPKPQATSFYVGPWENRCLFKALSHAIQHLFRHGEPAYSVERTLLVTGALDASMHSRQLGGKAMSTPQLEFAYTARDFRAFREMGASWKILHEGIPEPKGIHGA